jgi:inosine-uridine nucleoside N-ribohydrolase
MKNLILLFFFTLTFGVQAQKIQLLIDADTGNEMDDLYAITRAFDENEVELTGLISAHFNNPQLLTDSTWNNYSTKNINSLEISQMENEQLLKIAGRDKIPHPKGCEKMVGFSWGYYAGAQIPTSEGVDFILKEAKKATPENKLKIACLGAATNVAAAILLQPEIAKNIRLYILSMRFDPETKIWDKNEFNARNDLNAVDIILNQKDLELFVISAQVSGKLVFQRKETQEKLASYNNELSRNLSTRWDKVKAGETWIMWDLALIESILNPELATIEKTNTPPENVQRQINVFTDIQVEKMKTDFWNNYEILMDKLSRQ